jgi:hypothetical protein
MFGWFKKKEVEQSDPVVHKASGTVRAVTGGVDVTGRNEVDFQVLKEFAWVKDDGTVMANYVEGMVYRKRAGNLALQELLPKWEDEGKVKVIKARK